MAEVPRREEVESVTSLRSLAIDRSPFLFGSPWDPDRRDSAMVSFEELTDELAGDAAHAAALAAEGEGRLREAHRLLLSVLRGAAGASVRARVEADVRRVIAKMFGVRVRCRCRWGTSPLSVSRSLISF